MPWNLHEPERGLFNFQDQLDLKLDFYASSFFQNFSDKPNRFFLDQEGFSSIFRAYVTLAADLGLWVILRPGPYICAEWDLGGLPR